VQIEFAWLDILTARDLREAIDEGCEALLKARSCAHVSCETFGDERLVLWSVENAGPNREIRPIAAQISPRHDRNLHLAWPLEARALGNVNVQQASLGVEPIILVL
jgi:hypothetical protein